jgi:hypothetical protein
VLEAGGNASMPAWRQASRSASCKRIGSTSRVSLDHDLPRETREVVSIDGLGVWPRAASLGVFIERHGGDMPLAS